MNSEPLAVHQRVKPKRYVQFISELLEHPSLLAHFSGANNYTWLHFRNGERRLLSKPLIYFEERLPAFVRVHKTALINPACVASLQSPLRAKMPGTVRMQDGTELPVSRRRWNEVIRLLDGNPAEQYPAEPSPIGLPDSAHPAKQPDPYTSPPLVVLAVMTGDALLLTRQCIDGLGLNCRLYTVELSAELANVLLLTQERPALILLDARTNRPDRMVTLRALKSHAQLRSVPVVWLASPGDDTMQAYALDANSVVELPGEPSSFVRVIRQLCLYWLVIVQLPPKAD